MNLFFERNCQKKQVPVTKKLLKKQVKTFSNMHNQKKNQIFIILA